MDTTNGHRTSVSGPELREEREQAELTQEQLAEAMGVHRATVTRAEGLARVKPGLVRRYREALASLNGQSAA